MTLRGSIRAAAALPLRLIPASIRRRMVQATLTSLAASPPRDAVRHLLEVDDDLTASLNEAATRYENGVHAKHRLTGYHEFFVSRVGPNERVLDIGCGIGAVAFSVASRTGAQVTGIDKDPRNIEIARSRFQHPSLTFICGDALTDLPDRTFDTVVFSNVLEHLDRRTEFLVSAQRRLRPLRWLIRVPMFDRDWRVPLRKELGMFYFSDISHVVEYTAESFVAEMTAASLGVVHLQVNWGEIWAEVKAE